MSELVVRYLGLVDYQSTYDQMLALTDSRDEDTPDELWILEHYPVFTQGRAGKSEHVMNAGDIPIVQSDRGGQVTYHGPGQITGYVMLDLKRAKLGVRDLVSAIEQTLVDVLASYDITAHAKPDAPGVYVDAYKIASLGLRIRNGKSFHGLALNVDMNLEPFLRINPCGYAGLTMTQISNYEPSATVADVASRLVDAFAKQLSYQTVTVHLADEKESLDE